MDASSPTMAPSALPRSHPDSADAEADTGAGDRAHDTADQRADHAARSRRRLAPATPATIRTPRREAQHGGDRVHHEKVCIAAARVGR
jgi:hypothetical protein